MHALSFLVFIPAVAAFGVHVRLGLNGTYARWAEEQNNNE